MSLKARIFVASAWLACMSPTYAAGVLLGPLCLDGVSSTPRTSERTVTPSGTWTPIDYKLSSSSPRIVIFAQPIPETSVLETCAQTQARMSGLGVRPVVSGRLSSLDLRAIIFIGDGGNRVQINPDALAATLSSVDAGNHAVAGGMLSFAGSKLWVRSSKQILSTASSIQGALEVESWNRTIKDTRLHIPGGATFVSDLTPRNEGNMTVDLDLETGEATLIDGDLAGRPKLAATANIQLDVLQLSNAQIAAEMLRVTAKNGTVQSSLSKVTGKSSEARVPGTRLTWVLGATELAAQQIDAALTQSKAGMSLGPATVRGASLKSPDMKSLTSNGDSLATGNGALTAQILSARQVDLRGAWASPTTTALRPAFNDGTVTSFTMTVGGLQDSPMGSMQVSAKSLALGGLKLIRPTNLNTAMAPLSTELVLPIDLSMPAAGGSVEFHDGNGKVAIEGRLDALELHGRIVVPLDSLENTRFEIPAEKFGLKIGAAVSRSPFLAGAKPIFVSTTIAASNLSDVTVAKANRGHVLLSTGVIALGEPVFKIGDEGTTSPASLKLESEGSAKLLYNLERAKVEVAQAIFRAGPASFKLLGAAPRILDLNGDLIKEPTVDFKELLIEVDKLGPVAIERARLESLKVAAESIERRHVSGDGKGASYEGSVAQPFEVDSVQAAQVKFDDNVVLGGFDIQKVRFGLAGAKFDLGDGTKFKNANVQIAADRISQVKVGQKAENFYASTRAKVDGTLVVSTPDFSVNDGIGTRLTLNVSGPESALSGTGTLDVGAFTGNARGKLEIGFECKDEPKLKVPTEYNFAMGGVTLAVAMTNGELSGEGSMGPIAIDMHNVGSSGCRGPSEKKVIAEAGRGWTNGICTQVFPPKAWSCRWEWSTPEISFRYHIRLDVVSFNAAVAMSNPRFYYRKSSIAVCNVGAIAVGATHVVGGYSPQIETPFGGDGEKIVNAIIAAHFIAPQSLFGTSLLNGAGLFATSTLTLAGNALCIGRL